MSYATLCGPFLCTGPAAASADQTTAPPQALEGAAHVFVDNLLNKKTKLAFLAEQGASIPLYDRATTNQPRTVGLEVSARY